MEANDGSPDRDRSEHGWSDAGEDEGDDRDDAQNAEDGPLFNGSAEEEDRLIAGEEEEDPGGGEGDKGSEGAGVPEQGDGEHDEHREDVVGAEVGDVAVEAGGGEGGVGGEREGARVEELPPGALGRDQGFAVLLDAGDEVGGGIARRRESGRRGVDISSASGHGSSFPRRVAYLQRKKLESKVPTTIRMENIATEKKKY